MPWIPDLEQSCGLNVHFWPRYNTPYYLATSVARKLESNRVVEIRLERASIQSLSYQINQCPQIEMDDDELAMPPCERSQSLIGCYFE